MFSNYKPVNINKLNFHTQIQATIMIAIYMDLNTNIESHELNDEFKEFIRNIFVQLKNGSLMTNSELYHNLNKLTAKYEESDNEQIKLVLPKIQLILTNNDWKNNYELRFEKNANRNLENKDHIKKYNKDYLEIFFSGGDKNSAITIKKIIKPSKEDSNNKKILEKYLTPHYIKIKQSASDEANSVQLLQLLFGDDLFYKARISENRKGIFKYILNIKKPLNNAHFSNLKFSEENPKDFLTELFIVRFLFNHQDLALHNMLIKFDKDQAKSLKIIDFENNFNSSDINTSFDPNDLKKSFEYVFNLPKKIYREGLFFKNNYNINDINDNYNINYKEIFNFAQISNFSVKEIWNQVKNKKITQTDSQTNEIREIDLETAFNKINEILYIDKAIRSECANQIFDKLLIEFGLELEAIKNLNLNEKLLITTKLSFIFEVAQKGSFMNLVEQFDNNQCLETMLYAIERLCENINTKKTDILNYFKNIYQDSPQVYKKIEYIIKNAINILEKIATIEEFKEKTNPLKNTLETFRKNIIHLITKDERDEKLFIRGTIVLFSLAAVAIFCTFTTYFVNSLPCDKMEKMFFIGCFIIVVALIIMFIMGGLLTILDLVEDPMFTYPEEIFLTTSKNLSPSTAMKYTSNSTNQDQNSSPQI